MALDLGDVAKYGLTLIGGGAIGSLLTRWYDARARRHDLLVENRRKRVADWRAALNAAQSFEDVHRTSVWAELREHMDKKEVESMTHAVWLTVGGLIGGGDPKVMRLHRVVNEVERKWGLI